MAMVCPQCCVSYAQRWDCPKCHVRLVYRSSRSSKIASEDSGDGLPTTWQHTPWGSLLIGLLLAQGLNYVLTQLFTAGFKVAQEASVWQTLTGLVLLQALQAGSVFAAGMLTGAGQRRGLLFGAVVGVWNAVFLILIQLWTGQPLTTIDLFGLPVLQVAFGALGGLVGSLIWRPLPPDIMPYQPRKIVPSLPAQRSPSIFSGPVAWARVLTGITVAVGGVFWVDVIRDSVLEASEEKLRIDTHLQAELVTWEISALAMMVGGVLAGATTRNGSKQGLFVGLGTATVLSGIRLATVSHTPELVFLMLISALSLCFVGGWFGGHLLPPVCRPRRKRATAAPL